MKRILTKALIASLLAGGLSTAVAGYPCPAEDAYCLYVTDPSGQDGPHWLEINSKQPGKGPVAPRRVCVGSIQQSKNFILDEIQTDEITKTGETKEEISICKSDSGSCEKLEHGEFSVYCNKYNSNCLPSSAAIQLTDEEKDYPECRVSHSSNKPHLHE